MDTSPSRGLQGYPELWWVNPFKLCVFFLIPAYVAIFAIPHFLGPSSVVVKFGTYFTFQYFLLGLAYLAVLADFALLGGLRLSNEARTRRPPPQFNRYYLDLLGAVTVLAHLIWFGPLFLDLDTLRALATGQTGAVGLVRSKYHTIPGITTLTQLGPAYVILYLVQRWGSGRVFESRRYAAYFYAILGMTVFRMYAWAERLAFLELMLPIAVIYVVYRTPSNRPRLRTALTLLPFAGIFGLIILFGVTEYFRSWSSYYQYQGEGFITFVLKRLVTYYYTALNNGAGMLTAYEWHTGEYKYVLGWLNRFPFAVGPIFRFVIGVRPGENFLVRYADPEFNNPSGVFTPFVDLGLIGGFLFAAGVGVVTGYCYRSMVAGRGIGVVLYPLLFVALIETFRVLYVGESRVFPIFVALIVAHLLFRERSMPEALNNGPSPLPARH